MATILVGGVGRVLLEGLNRDLLTSSYELVVAQSGRQIRERVLEDSPDVVVLGEGLDNPSLLDTCRILREDSTVPIVLVSRSDDELDRILGLELGADDYLVEPLSSRALLTHVRALFRRIRMVEERAAEVRGDVIRSGNLIVDLPRHLAYLSGKPIVLKPREFDLLAFFVRHPGIVYNREQIFQAVWGQTFPEGTRTVDIHIRCLRQKIEADPSKPTRITTVRHIGYRLVDHVSSTTSTSSLADAEARV